MPIALGVLALRMLVQFLGSIRLAIDPTRELVGVIAPQDVAAQAQEEIREAMGDAAVSATISERMSEHGADDDAPEGPRMTGAIFGIGYNDPVLVGIICICLLFALSLIGVRVAFAAAIAGFIGLVELIGFWPGATTAGTIPYAKTSLYALSVLPPFVLIGFLAFHAGMTATLFDAARKWLGWLPGGLAVATIMAQTGFAAVSGASTATAAVFSRIAIPEMLAHNY